MRLLYLTAGAAEMYCGSCLRDNALAGALMQRGHDVVLAPVYTPTTTDEKNVSSAHVLFGGISVYLEQHVPLFRNSPAFLDRLWDSTPVLKLAAKRQIKVDPHLLGSMTVSMLKGADGYQHKEVDKMLRWLDREPRFDVINLPFTLLIGLAKPLKDALGVPIACTLQGEDLFLENLEEPYKSQSIDLIRRAVPHVDRFISVSRYYTGFMADYLGIPSEKIDTVPLGINLGGHDAKPLRTEPPYTVGYFGRIAPEKGVHLLAEAYRALKRRPDVPRTRLVAGGYMLDEHREYLDGVRKQLGDWGIAGDFHYAGAPDRAGKIALLQSFDVMSMPSIYHEPKGFTLLEAMANGVPIVQPAHGAFVEIIEATGGGLLVEPENPDALANAWYELLTDRVKAQALGTAGADGVRRHYALERMASAAEAAYTALIVPGAPRS